MRRRVKRWISWLLCLAVFVSMLPLSVFAENGGDWVLIQEGSDVYTYEQADKFSIGGSYAIVAIDSPNALMDDNGTFVAQSITDGGTYVTATEELMLWRIYKNYIYNGNNYLKYFNNNFSLSDSYSNALVITFSDGTAQIYGSGSNKYYFYYDEYNKKWNTSVKNTAQEVRLYQLVSSPISSEYAKISGELTYTVENGTAGDAALEAVKTGITGYTNTTNSGDGTKLDDSVLTWTWDTSYDGSVAGDYIVIISYGGKELGRVTVTVSEKKICEDGSHTGGTATCKEKAVCTVCETPYGGYGDHSEISYSADASVITAVCGICEQDVGTATISCGGETYNGEAHHAVVYGTGILEKQETNIIYDTADGAAPVETGTYTASITIENATASVQFTIDRAKPEVKFPSASVITYGDTLEKAALSGGAGDGSFAWEDGSIVPNAGTPSYNVVFAPKDTRNYDYSGMDLKQPVTVTVEKANPDVGTVSCDVRLFDNTDITTVKLTRSDETVPGKLELTDNLLTVGTNRYNWRFTPEDIANYNIITGTVELTVSADELEKLEVSGSLEKTEYEHGDSFSLDGLTVTAVYTSGATADVTGEVTYNSTLAAGQTAIDLSYSEKTCTVDGFTVTKKKLDVSGIRWTVPTDAVYNGSKYTAVLNGTLPEGVTVATKGDTATDAGSYTATAAFMLADGYDSSNYEIVNGADLTANWSISKAEPVVTPPTPKTDLTYNAELQILAAAGATSGGTMQYSLNGETYSAVMPSASDAGTYTLYYRVVGGKNYTDIAANAVTVAIAAKEVTTPIFDGLKEYYLYTGSGIEPGFKLMDGTMEIPQSEYSVKYSDNTDVGTTVITIEDHTGGNYAVSGSATFEIKTHAHVWVFRVGGDGKTITAVCEGEIGNCSYENDTLTLVFSAENRAYTGSLYDGIAIQDNGSGFLNATEMNAEVTFFLEDGATKTTGANSGAVSEGGPPRNAGKYTAVLTVADVRYGGKTYIMEGFSVEKRQLTVSAEDQTIAYGRAISDTKYTISGLVDGHTGVVLLMPSTVNVTVGGTITPSTAAITAGTDDVTANYNISYVPGKLEIKPDVSELEKLTTETVTAEDRETIEAVLAMMAAAETKGIDEATRQEWDAITAKCKALIDKLEEAAMEACDGTGNCPAGKYADVNAGAWYHEAVDFVITKGYMQGYANGSFGPDDTLSRAMVVQILYNLEQRPEVSGADSYVDTAPDAWYAEAVLWAAQNGITIGYGDGRFGPGDPATREQIATILYRYGKLKGYDLTEGSCEGFPDAGQISSYARSSMNWAVGKGLFIGTEQGMLCAEYTAARAEMATILERFYQNVYSVSTD